MKRFHWTMAIWALCLLGLLSGSTFAIEAKGKITYLDLTKHEFTLTKADASKLTFRLPKDIKVQLDEKEARLSDLKVGDQVTVNYTSKNEILNVTDVTARRISLVGAGTITYLLLDKNEFTLTTAKGGKLTFRFKKDIKMQLNDKEVRLSDLKVGDYVTLNYSENGADLIVSNVHASRGNTEATGKITYLDLNKNEFTMTSEKAGKLTFRFQKDTKVQLNAKDARLSDLKVGDDVSINYIREGENLTVNAVTAKRKN